MNKQKKIRCSAVFMGICGLLSLCGAACALEEPAESLCGIMRISMTPGQAEMPAARFDHERHVKRLGGQGGECVVCHAGLDREDADSRSRPFAATPAGGTDRNVLMSNWHRVCFDCHAEYDKAPEPSSCRSCHDAGTDPEERLPVHFGRSLHAVHVNSSLIAPVMPSRAERSIIVVKNCGACHGITTQDGARIYEQNTEDAASFYKVDSTDSRVLASAAHNACVNCHRRTMKSRAGNGEELKLPVLCSDCHSAEGQAAFPGDDPSFRLLRGQPDSVLLGVRAADELSERSADPEAALRPVPFDHKLHERYSACRVCHGMKVEKSGGQPATMAGAGPDGRVRTAYEAAHDADAASSCVGCHVRVVAENRNCAGCHKGLSFAAKDSCVVCHRGEPVPVVVDADDPAAFPVFLTEVKKTVDPVPPEDIPETVVIDGLSQEYRPVEMPHRRIYAALLRGMEESELAASFHTESVCGACHHHIPAVSTGNPPSCVSCHDKEVGAVSVGSRPHLKAAYHQMCIRCHDNMDVRPAAADCAGCHAPVDSKDTNTTKREVR